MSNERTSRIQRRRALPRSTYNRISRLIILIVIALGSGLIGETYGSLVYGNDEFTYYLGFRNGFSIGLISAAIELYYVRSVRRSWIRRVAFLPGLMVRILVLTLIIRTCLVGNELLTNYLLGTPLSMELEWALQVRDTLFSMLIVVLFVIVSQLTSIVGLRHFINLVIGRYFKPISENRVFLFVDLIGSTELARRLGNERFHEYLAEFFYQLDQAIVATGGEVVSYVGDAVIVTWPLGDNRTRNARCLLALEAMLHRIDYESDNFRETFGEVPIFRAALHGGDVVVGECGNSRRQVTFLGDAVNIASRIETVSKETGEKMLATNIVLEQMAIPDGITTEPAGEHRFKGADEPFQLSRIVFTS